MPQAPITPQGAQETIHTHTCLETVHNHLVISSLSAELRRLQRLHQATRILLQELACSGKLAQEQTARINQLLHNEESA